MKLEIETIKVTEKPLRIPAGAEVVLTDAQIARRRLVVEVKEKQRGGAVCVARAPLEFKVGETVQIAGELSKAQRGELEPAKAPADVYGRTLSAKDAGAIGGQAKGAKGGAGSGQDNLV